MSKEFEDAVLKKLDSLENKLVLFEKSTQEKFDSMEERFDLMEKTTNERFNSMEEKFDLMEKTTTEKFNSMEEKYDLMDKSTKDRFCSLEQALKNIEIELKDTQEVVISLNQRFIKFDYEINKKIDTLFDACFVNTEKDTMHEENINSLNSKVLNHDIRISNLENKVLVT